MGSSLRLSPESTWKYGAKCGRFLGAGSTKSGRLSRLRYALNAHSPSFILFSSVSLSSSISASLCEISVVVLS